MTDDENKVAALAMRARKGPYHLVDGKVSASLHFVDCDEATMEFAVAAMNFTVDTLDESDDLATLRERINDLERDLASEERDRREAEDVRDELKSQLRLAKREIEVLRAAKVDA